MIFESLEDTEHFERYLAITTFLTRDSLANLCHHAKQSKQPKETAVSLKAKAFAFSEEQWDYKVDKWAVQANK